MRALALLAATAMMHMVRALPRQDLAVRQSEHDLSNESHVFHHLDRNPRTANRNRVLASDKSAGGVESHVFKGLPDRSQRAGGWTVKERAMNRRFIQDPDYQEDPGDGSNSTSPASNTMPTQQPATIASEKPGEADNSHERP